MLNPCWGNQNFTVIKDPSAVLAYGLDWASPAAPAGTFPYLPPGVTITDLSIDLDTGMTYSNQDITANASGVAASQTTAVFSAGVAGTNYVARFTITRSDGYTDVRSITFQCVSR